MTETPADHLSIFQALRPRLFGMAYRMLGTRGDAEDVLQDAWLRWHQQDLTPLRSHEAWLMTLVTRLAIDRLRQVQADRISYVGMWLPEPLVEPMQVRTPECLMALSDDVSIAFLYLLERLQPEERAAYLLRQVFDHDYADVACLLGKTEAACRQLVHRAREHLKEERPRVAVSQAQHERLLQCFVEAAMSGRKEAIQALLSEDALLIGDGGGKMLSVLRPLHGAWRIANLFDVVHRRFGSILRYEVAWVNGVPGLVRYLNGHLESVMAFQCDADRIVAIHTVRNPDKLVAVHGLVTDQGGGASKG